MHPTPIKKITVVVEQPGEGVFDDEDAKATTEKLSIAVSIDEKKVVHIHNLQQSGELLKETVENIFKELPKLIAAALVSQSTVTRIEFDHACVLNNAAKVYVREYCTEHGNIETNAPPPLTRMGKGLRGGFGFNFSTARISTDSDKNEDTASTLMSSSSSTTTSSSPSNSKS